ncbi:MAG: hypothetical protein AAFV88_17815, partial [Planctomycetota bacterium]
IQTPLAKACVNGMLGYADRADDDSVPDRWQRYLALMERLERLASNGRWVDHQAIMESVAKAIYKDALVTFEFENSSPCVEKMKSRIELMNSIASRPWFQRSIVIQSEYGKLLGLVCFLLPLESNIPELKTLWREWSSQILKCCRERPLNESTVSLLMTATKHVISRESESKPLASEVRMILTSRFGRD